MAKKDEKTTDLPPIKFKTPEQEPPKVQEPSGLTMPGVEDRGKALSAIAEAAFNFPKDRLFSWSRWLPREIPLIASEMTRMAALDPKIRPKNPDGSVKRLAVIYIEWMAWLRLAEKGALRGEAKEMFGMEAQKEGAGGGWPSDMER